MAIDAETLRDVPELNRPPLGLLGQIVGLLGGTQSSGAVFTSDDALIAELRDRIVVARERDSRVISIAFRAEDPGLAARVANALARAHVQRRADLLLEDTSDATVWLEREIEGLRGRVSEAESKVANYRVDHDLFDGGGDTSLLQQQMSDVTAQISAASERRNMVETQARLIRGLLDAGQPVETIAEVRASPVIQQLAEQKASLQAQRAERAATLLASHPAVRALDAQIAELTAEIQAEGRRIAQAFDSQAALEAEHGQSLRDGLARLKIQASSAEIDGVTLAELDREAAAERDLLNAFLIRYREAAARTNSDAALPDVRIVSTAAEPDLPVYPQKSLLVAAVAMVTIVLQVGAILLGELAGGTVFVPRQNRADDEREDDDYMRRGKQSRRAEPRPADDIEEAVEPAEAAPALEIAAPARKLRRKPEAIAEPEVEPEPEPSWFADRAEIPDLPAEPEPVEDPVPEIAAPAAIEPPIAESDPWPDLNATQLRQAEQPRDIRAGPPTSGPIAALAALAAGAPAEQRQAAGPPTGDELDDLLFEAEPFAIGEMDEPGEEPEPIPDATEEPRVSADPAGVPESQPALARPSEEDFDLRWDEATLTSGTAPPEGPTPQTKPQFGKSAQHIAMHLAANNVRLALIASADLSREDRIVAGKVAVELLGLGHSVALVDAGGRGGEVEGLGLTDLTAGLADYGEVVRNVEGANLYHVPWGRQLRLDVQSPRIPTLIEALGEIHDHVLILCGPMELPSVLPVFARSGVSLVLAGSAETTVEQIARMSNEARAAGYGQVSLARTDTSEVA
ncbi:MAG: GumC family protein [Cucumibacter sp.]